MDGVQQPQGYRATMRRQFTFTTNKALWPSGLGNYFVCNRFTVQALPWSLEFVIQVNLEHGTIAV